MQIENFSLVTGPSGCGKSTILGLIVTHLADRPKEGKHPKIRWSDTSALIENSKRNRTPAGLALIEQSQDQRNGKILRAEDVFDSIIENIANLPADNDKADFMLAGSPRSIREAELLMGLKVKTVVFHITMDKAELASAIEQRIAKGTIREDDAPHVVEARWAEYQRKVIPSLKVFPKGAVVELRRSDRLIDKIEKVVMKMPLPDNIRRKWMNKLHTSSHPIHEEIARITGTMPANAVRREQRIFTSVRMQVAA